MAVKIRLRRTGRKKQPSYRLVVADSATPRNGQYLDSLGTYNPLVKPADLRIDLEKVERWLANGAELSDTASLIRKARLGGRQQGIAVRRRPEAKPDGGDVVAAAEPSKPARAGSRGSGGAEEPAAAAAGGGHRADRGADGGSAGVVRDVRTRVRGRARSPDRRSHHEGARDER
jgi:small subunit ribosomal protein S16